VETIKFRMEQEGLTRRDLEPCIGPSGRISEVLNRKRRLSLRLVEQLPARLGYFDCRRHGDTYS
jgi:HTH-type transcriptional regulator/antitoxin HigA